MTPKEYVPNDFDIFIGLDVDKKSYVLNARDRGQTSHAKKIQAKPETLLNYINKQHPGKRVICAYETGPTGFGLYDYATKKGVPCLVVSPLSIPKAKNETTKTNKIDAEKISEYLQLGKLRSVRVPIGEYRELRHLVRVRENYAIKRKKAKQQIKALLLQESLYSLLRDPEAGWSRKYVEELKKVDTTDAVRYRLDMLLTDLEYARVQLLSANRRLKELCKMHPEIGRYTVFLRSIPGIGFVLAVTILGKIGDPLRMNNIRELAAFMGMVPWENSTGETENKGSITHFGNQILRNLLVEAAWVAIRKDVTLRQFYFRIKNRNHPRCAAKKAIVAVARKMTHIIYRVLKDQRMYMAH